MKKWDLKLILRNSFKILEFIFLFHFLLFHLRIKIQALLNKNVDFFFISKLKKKSLLLGTRIETIWLCNIYFLYLIQKYPSKIIFWKLQWQYPVPFSYLSLYCNSQVQIRMKRNTQLLSIIQFLWDSFRFSCADN